MWLISKVFRLSWIGGGLIALRLLFEMIKGIAGAARNAAEMGSTAFTEKNYQKKGFIPQEDFFWIAEDCGSVFEEGRLNLNNSIGEISIISYEAVERGLKAAPDNEETAYVRQSAALCLQAAHENGHSNFEPKIIKTMLFPIAIGFVIIARLFVSMLVILEGFEQSLTSVAIIGFFMAILGVYGTVLLWKKKAVIGYIPFVAMIACFWIATSVFSDLSINVMENLIITTIILIPCFLYLPYTKGKKNSVRSDV